MAATLASTYAECQRRMGEITKITLQTAEKHDPEGHFHRELEANDLLSELYKTQGHFLPMLMCFTHYQLDTEKMTLSFVSTALLFKVST